jgi:type IV secretory pathway protease TraF
MNLARYRKAIVGAIGLAATIAATIPTDTPAWRWAQVIVALATALGVYGVRNAPPVTRDDLKQATAPPPDDPFPKQSQVGKRHPKIGPR